MLPCMNVELVDSLSTRGISSLQQLLNFPKATLQTMIGNFPASRLFQVWSSLKDASMILFMCLPNCAHMEC